jgi:hypothetical protein
MDTISWRRRVLTINRGWDRNGGWAGIDVAKCRREGLKGVGTVVPRG